MAGAEAAGGVQGHHAAHRAAPRISGACSPRCIAPLPALALFFLIASCRAQAVPARLELHDGDIVFQHSQSPQSKIVVLATGSQWSHMGIVWIKDGAPWVLEAEEPVQLTPLEKWRVRGMKKQIVIKRIAGWKPSPETIEKFHSIGTTYLGRHYDVLFRWDDDRLYCSELVYKLLDAAAGIKVGKLSKAGEMRLAEPEVQKVLQKRFKKAKFNPDEPVISPQAIFDDPKLETIFAN
jgi:hypothetical protein